MATQAIRVNFFIHGVSLRVGGASARESGTSAGLGHTVTRGTDMGAMRRAGVWLGLIEDEDERGYGYDEHGYEDEDPEDEATDSASLVRARVAGRLAEQRAERNADREAVVRTRLDRAHPLGADDVAVRPMTRPVAAPGGSYPTQDNLALVPDPVAPPASRPAPDPEPESDRRYQITAVHPTTYSEARSIGEHFRDGTPVIIDLTDIAEADAKRLVDFAAGLAFGLRGTMERVANRVFLLSPANVKVTPEDRAKIAEGGFLYRS